MGTESKKMRLLAVLLVVLVAHSAAAQTFSGTVDGFAFADSSCNTVSASWPLVNAQVGDCITETIQPTGNDFPLRIIAISAADITFVVCNTGTCTPSGCTAVFGPFSNVLSDGSACFAGSSTILRVRPAYSIDPLVPPSNPVMPTE